MEVWKPVAGFEGVYEISNLGNLRSLDRLVCYRKDRPAKTKGRIIKGKMDRYGYWSVTISSREKGRLSTTIHRLVAKAFIPLKEGKTQVNHINGVKTDNRVDNLEWVNNSENQKHSYRHLGRKVNINRFGGVGADALYKKAVKAFKDGVEIGSYPTVRMAAKETGVSLPVIFRVLSKRQSGNRKNIMFEYV